MKPSERSKTDEMQATKLSLRTLLMVYVIRLCTVDEWIDRWVDNLTNRWMGDSRRK